MVEALMSFAGNGQIAKRPGGWIIQDMMTGGPDLPQNLRDFAKSRLSSLDLRLRRLLEIIAVLDYPVTLFHLKELSQRSTPSLLSDLQALVVEGFLHRLVNDTGDHYEFHHRCVREVIYEEMEFARRRTLHLRAGELLENSSCPLPDSLLEKVAYHFIEGMDRDKGPDYAFKAAAISYEHFSLHRAIDLLVQGLNLLPRQNTSKRFEGLEAVTKLLGFAGDLPRASKFYFEMLLVAKTIGASDKEALAIREMGRVLIEGGDITRGLSYAEEAEKRFSHLADSAGLASAVILQAQAHLKTGNLARADERAELAYSDSVRAGDIQGQSLARSVGGLIAFELGEPERALAFYEEAFQLAVRINDISASAVILNNIGLAYLEQNLIKRAQPYFTKALNEARAKGLSLPATLASINLGEVNRLEGILPAAEELFQEALALADGANRKYLL
ncbi:MAG TPA: tetratricopeptide repeat protein, partial [Candidatus Binatus sp.]|nr:tetratricopeptide repeat protein [Candidatus Binatus sp.]